MDGLILCLLAWVYRKPTAVGQNSCSFFFIFNLKVFMPSTTIKYVFKGSTALQSIIFAYIKAHFGNWYTENAEQSLTVVCRP